MEEEKSDQDVSLQEFPKLLEEKSDQNTSFAEFPKLLEEKPDQHIIFDELPTPLDEFPVHLKHEVFPEFTPSSNYDNSSNYFWSHLSLSRRIWEYIMFIVSLFVLIELSYVIVFDIHISVDSYSFFFILDILQLFDNFVVMHTPFLRNGVMVSDTLEIVKNYGIIAFSIHVFASLPLGWIGIIKRDLLLYGILSINRLFRLHQTYRSYKLINNSTMYSVTFSRLIPYIFLFLFCVHIFACIFFLLARFQSFELSWIAPYAFRNWSSFQMYIVSIYFVLTTIMTVGYGHLHPVNSTESNICIVIQVLGVCLQAIIISKMVTLLDQPSANEYISRYETIQQYLEFKNVPTEYRNHVRHYYQYRWESNRGAPNWNELLKNLPDSIKSAIKLELCEKAFSACELFKGMRQKYMLMLMDTMDAFTYIPGEIIFTQGDLASDLLIFNTGIIETIVDGVPIGTSTVDKPFVDGERSLFFDEPKTKTLKAISFVDGWRLRRVNFANFIQAKPDLKKVLYENAKEKFPADLSSKRRFSLEIYQNESDSWNTDEMPSADEWIYISDDSSSIS